MTMAAAVADDRGGSDSNNADLRCSRPRAAVPVVVVMVVVVVVVVVVMVVAMVLLVLLVRVVVLPMPV